MLMAPRPEIALAAPFDLVGRGATLALDVRDGTGLRSLKVTIRQGDQEQTVVDETYQPPLPEVHREWRPGKETRFRLKEGPGLLRVEARNASWGNFFRGKTATFEKDFTARLTPPRLEVLTTQHYVNQGGCDMVVYRVTPPGAESGVAGRRRLLQGLPPAGGDATPPCASRSSPIPTTRPRARPCALKARDEAGNEVVANFNVKVFPQAVPHARACAIDDAFLKKVVPEILSQTPSLHGPGRPAEELPR